jgi:hypothetical protein
MRREVLGKEFEENFGKMCSLALNSRCQLWPLHLKPLADF